jgi:hypothetical protein
VSEREGARRGGDEPVGVFGLVGRREELERAEGEEDVLTRQEGTVSRCHDGEQGRRMQEEGKAHVEARSRSQDLVHGSFSRTRGASSYRAKLRLF